MLAFTMNAQTSSGNEFIDGMLQEADAITSMYEQELVKQGIKSQIQLFLILKKMNLYIVFVSLISDYLIMLVLSMVCLSQL